MATAQLTPEQIVEEWQRTLSAEDADAGGDGGDPEQRIPWLRGLIVTSTLLAALAAEIFHVVTTSG